MHSCWNPIALASSVNIPHNPTIHFLLLPNFVLSLCFDAVPALQRLRTDRAARRQANMAATEKMDVDPNTSTGKHTAGFGPFETDPEIDQKISAAVALVKTESRQAAIDKLLSIERVNRMAAAAPETSVVCVAIIRILHAEKDWRAIGEHVVLISKRRAQLKAAVTRTVQEAMSYLDETPDEETKLALLQTLRDVTAGKIYVELERARLTRTLAKIREKNGDIEGAAEIMQETQVETFSGMERKEKFDFILEQMRLCMEKNDFIRAAIIAKKIMPRQLNRDELKEIKMRFYSHMIRIHARNSDYLEICRAYLERYEAYCAEENLDLAVRELKLACLFLVLSPRDSMQSDLLHRIQEFKNMEHVPVYADLLKLFSTHELIRWTILRERYAEELGSVVVLAAEEIKDEKIPWESSLHERVTEHNLRVVSKYYSRIRLGNLAKLLDLSDDETERKLAAMVSDKKALWAKIDRPAQIVSFAKPKDADAILNGWASNVTQLLDIVERTCHLVHRETMVHGMKVESQNGIDGK